MTILALLAAGSLPAAQRVVDDDGQVLELPGPVQRIVSLAPGATAMLFAAGAGGRVVATSRFSEEPDAARSIARIGDAQNFDIERILALRPDVVVAWSGGTPPLALERLERLGLRVYRHRVERLDDFAPALRRLGALAGTPAPAAAAAQDLERRIAALRARSVAGRRPSVLIQIWDRPVYTVGRAQLLSDVVEACGFRNLFEDLGAPGPAVAVEAVIARDPDVILAVAPDAAAARAWLDGWRAYPSLRAVRQRRLLAQVDTRLSRMGPQSISAAEALCQSLASLPRAGM
ncbi:MAG: ABC transporter substrate-binding protein [Gammaproteobacteria bacterium]|nr:ABC transporter substrate-binding protein [Gammaproteobacteria bacterium]